MWMKNLKRERFQCKHPQKCKHIDWHGKKREEVLFLEILKFISFSLT